MADTTTVDQLRSLLATLTAEEDAARAAEQQVKAEEALSHKDRIALVRAEQAGNGNSVSAQQLEHVLKMLESLVPKETVNKEETPWTGNTSSLERPSEQASQYFE